MMPRAAMPLHLLEGCATQQCSTCWNTTASKTWLDNLDVLDAKLEGQGHLNWRSISARTQTLTEQSRVARREQSYLSRFSNAQCLEKQEQCLAPESDRAVSPARRAEAG